MIAARATMSIVANVKAPPPSLRDRAWRLAYRLGFPLARLWWSLWRVPHEGALVAVHVGPALLLVRSSYRAGWSFPGGGVRKGESPEAAARRELAEEIGLAAPVLRPAGVTCGIFDGRPDRVHFFALHLDRLPPLHLDNREITDARLFTLDGLQDLRLTGSVIAYLERILSPRPRFVRSD